MKDDKIPDDHCVVRHIAPREIITDPETGVERVIPQAFRRRDGEDYLSCAWREYYPGSADEQFAACVATFRSIRDIRPNSGFVVGNVAAIKEAAASRDCKIRIVKEPIENFEAHAGVRQLNDADMVLLDMLAGSAWGNLKRAKNIP